MKLLAATALCAITIAFHPLPGHSATLLTAGPPAVIPTDAAWKAAPYRGNDPYMHNGSEMELELRGNFVRITYVTPKPSLMRNGVRPGTLLFSGRVRDDHVEGVAYTFAANCPTAGYAVTGMFNGQRKLVLAGPAPQRDRNCAIVTSSAVTTNAVLTFLPAFGD
jgi:hypothetical protein